MKNVKKEAKESFLFIILLIVFAIVLIINPDDFISIAINVFGYISILLGVILSFYYLRKKEEANYLTRGIILISFGILALIKTTLLANVFTIILGGYLIIQNASRVSISLSLKNLKQKSWSYILEFSCLNIILSFLLFFDPLVKMSPNIYMAVIIIIIEAIMVIENIIILISKEKKEHLENN